MTRHSLYCFPLPNLWLLTDQFWLLIMALSITSQEGPLHFCKPSTNSNVDIVLPLKFRRSVNSLEIRHCPSAKGSPLISVVPTFKYKMTPRRLLRLLLRKSFSFLLFFMSVVNKITIWIICCLATVFMWLRSLARTLVPCMSHCGLWSHFQICLTRGYRYAFYDPLDIYSSAFPLHCAYTNLMFLCASL